jgi:hypothetical protein
MVRRDTHRKPAPAGAIVLKRDCAVADKPFAAPLCLCDCYFKQTELAYFWRNWG